MRNLRYYRTQAHSYQALDAYNSAHKDGKMLLTVACPAGTSYFPIQMSRA